jgi:hypothetical protein
MTNDRDAKEELAERLLAEDALGRASPPPTGRWQASDGNAVLAALLEQERAFERRVRRAAVASWSALLALVPLLGVAFFVVRVGGGLLVEVTRAAVIVVGILAILALFLAVLTTVTWLFRSRTASLAVIERRLAALEELLLRSGRARSNAS